MRLLLLLLMFLPGIHFASAPYKANALMLEKSPVAVTNKPVVPATSVHQQTGHKMNFFQRWQWKIIQKKIARKFQREEGKKTSKDTLANIALIAGIAGLPLLFLIPIAGFALLITAIITGILGMSKNDNPKSHRKALIGLIIGAVATGLIIIAVIAFVSGGIYRY